MQRPAIGQPLGFGVWLPAEWTHHVHQIGPLGAQCMPKRLYITVKPTLARLSKQIKHPAAAKVPVSQHCKERQSQFLYGLFHAVSAFIL